MVGNPRASHSSGRSRSDTAFDIARRGYDQAQVDAHLARLDAQIRVMATDRLATVDQADQLTRELGEARDRTDRLRAQVRTLVSPPQSVQGMSERMRAMLRLAEDEVTEMLGHAETEVNDQVREAESKAVQTVADAEAEAEGIRAGARLDAERLAEDSARARAELEAANKAAAAALAAERADVERRVSVAIAAAEQEQAAAWEESERRRTLIEEDFLLAMNHRRAEALAALKAEHLLAGREMTAQREAAAATVRGEVERAQLEARRIVADAERRVTELIALRRRVVEQLGSARAALDRTIGGLDLLPGESAAGAASDSAGSVRGGAAPAEPPGATSAPAVTSTTAIDTAPEAGDIPAAEDVPAAEDHAAVDDTRTGVPTVAADAGAADTSVVDVGSGTQTDDPAAATTPGRSTTKGSPRRPTPRRRSAAGVARRS